MQEIPIGLLDRGTVADTAQQQLAAALEAFLVQPPPVPIASVTVDERLPGADHVARVRV